MPSSPCRVSTPAWLKWGCTSPDGYICFISVIALLAISYNLSKHINVQNHDFLTINATNGETFSLKGFQGEIKISSDRIPFEIEIQGQFSVGQIEDLCRYYSKETTWLDSTSIIPIYVLVTERSKAKTHNYWWAHKNNLDIKSNGIYKANCLLGGIGLNAAEDGQLFGVRIFIPKDPNVKIKDDGSKYDDIDTFPPLLFLSNEISIKTLRSDNFKN